MQMQLKKGYVEFSAEILQDWIDSGVSYIKLVEVEMVAPYSAFELIPNSEIPEEGEMIHNIHSEDISELLEGMELVKFLVHEVYLEEEEEV